MGKENSLYNLNCFHGVSLESLDTLWSMGKVQHYEKNELILRAKEPLESIYIQMSGKSIVYNLTHHGKRKILFIFGRGAMLNEHIMNTHTAAFYCEAIEKSSVFVVPVTPFLQCMKQDFSLTCAVLDAQERKIWRLGHQLKNTMGSIYMERKLAAKLWKLARDFGIEKPEGIEIDINMPITFLADMLGAPRETTSKTCKTLIDYGLISIRRKRITVVDPERMAYFYKTGKF